MYAKTKGDINFFKCSELRSKLPLHFFHCSMPTNGNFQCCEGFSDCSCSIQLSQTVLKDNNLSRIYNEILLILV
jgi:hypothetical protein